MDTTVEQTDKQLTIPAVTVKVERDIESSEIEFHFTKPFRIGRDKKCQVALQDIAVSSIHAEVFFKDDQWWLRDLGSTNGTFNNGQKVKRLAITGKTKIVLGAAGPLLTFEIAGTPHEEKTIPDAQQPLAYYKQHYFEDGKTELAGQHTMMVRKAFKEVRQSMTRRYFKIIAVVGILGICAAVYAYFKHEQVLKQQAVAQDVFYQLKSLELAYAGVQRRVAADKDQALPKEFVDYLTKRKELTASYERFVNELGIYGEDLDEKEKTIYRVARIFGECEIAMPEEFVGEVMNYVKLWRSSSRLPNAIRRAEENNYAPMIAGTLIEHDMPPQFFYLALQESEFDNTVCGPPTRFGIAKGMWQFIPATAIQYGLRTGPLVHLAKTDPRDERHDVEKSTAAAATYLRDIYDTEAQASGLLVMASYNWGHNIVKSLIRQLPENPKERNFWNFLKTYGDKIPKQTYDYVFYIFSAAVIGENPSLFGFEFEKPFDRLSLQAGPHTGTPTATK
ncbi:MAG: FHA domain-containing protein [Ignavibacteria bacterium]|nr:FHA domain-containing protein [Ignavibacteria bacterium]